MGKVAITYRILPENPEVNISSLDTSIREILGSKLIKLEEKPIAFGLKAIIVTVILDDASGEGESVESSLNSIAGVGSIETQDISLA